MEKSELDQKEVLSYYDDFYTRDDFRYYSETVTWNFFLGIFSKCHIPLSGKILDVGCGTGYYCKIFHELGFESVGVDFSRTAIDKAKQKYPNLEFHVADAMNLPFEPETFDVILSYGCSVVSTHDLSKIHSYVRHLVTFLKPGGWLFLIGGSNLSGKRLTTSTWLCHTWEDLRQFIPDGNWLLTGPFLSNVRIVASLGKWSLNPVLTSFLRHFPSSFLRTTFHLVKKSPST